MMYSEWHISRWWRCVLTLAVGCMVLCAMSSCSTKHNTPMTRAWHSFAAHYNTLYNGQMA